MGRLKKEIKERKAQTPEEIKQELKKRVEIYMKLLCRHTFYDIAKYIMEKKDYNNNINANDTTLNNERVSTINVVPQPPEFRYL